MAVLVPDLLIAFEIVWFVLVLVGNVGGMVRSLFKQGSSFRARRVCRTGRWVLLSGLDSDVLELFAFFLRVKRSQSRSDFLINWCSLPGMEPLLSPHSAWWASLLSAVLPGWMGTCSTLCHLCLPPLVSDRGQELSPPPALLSCAREATELCRDSGKKPNSFVSNHCMSFVKTSPPKH